MIQQFILVHPILFSVLIAGALLIGLFCLVLGWWLWSIIR